MRRGGIMGTIRNYDADEDGEYWPGELAELPDILSQRLPRNTAKEKMRKIAQQLTSSSDGTEDKGSAEYKEHQREAESDGTGSIGYAGKNHCGQSSKEEDDDMFYTNRGAYALYG
ncbi:uncharacterized protein MONOS_8044c1 [Monocercomonoides exilis]|uniref:uncharacterized protein n=1 Tax=Monocercomonoides exilis TaxID=2049356 RepID=UPI00355A25A9|nr:hypothetical protein MONOS_8044c2 [Monocercomonoides exilis]KAH7815202.1 hypothetical protein MONOS_8044c1 [Monocercomonoides exilis]|eukprot:MONOS_8044.1-p1 / transcript=MONOS_8044.1 / gene=MONOS_8044 / organism=Monocercomonoides_exilis_PA203 / gene_product=unspecified product / transcript_product=unspecified product / location=Mono_scaffold00292:54821-55308(-) / protein_length=115 / sequence_SO=supercontig / SO=protein_coding / is_pseudo=false